jgi:hypothetical protein
MANADFFVEQGRIKGRARKSQDLDGGQSPKLGPGATRPNSLLFPAPTDEEFGYDGTKLSSYF